MTAYEKAANRFMNLKPGEDAGAAGFVGRTQECSTRAALGRKTDPRTRQSAHNPDRFADYPELCNGTDKRLLFCYNMTR